jgi:hypothetical protein
VLPDDADAAVQAEELALSFDGKAIVALNQAEESRYSRLEVREELFEAP